MEKSQKANEVLLITVRNDLQAALVENLLKEQTIYCAKRHLPMGAIASLYTGMSNLGIDIYVNEEDLEAAKEIITVYETMISEEELEKQVLESIEKEDAETSKNEDSASNDYKEAKGGIGKPYQFAAGLLLLLIILLLLRILR